MLFNSFHFLVFFPLVFIVYFTIPHKYRRHLLLLASCYFYMVFIPYYILILAGVIIIDYFAGIAIQNASTYNKRKLFLIFSIIANVGVLAVFKYYNFFLDNLVTLSLSIDFPLPPINYLAIALPIGLSFHTFQAMSYTIEVFRASFKAEKSFITYSLYVMFFPQLVAGPIERPQNLLPQFYVKHHFDYHRIVAGLKQMLWGLFKKIVIADRLSVLVSQGFDNIPANDNLSMILYVYFFAFQIYCDFSGYSDIAIGAAKVLGFSLRQNFHTPYFSSSIREFWQRWHISLSSWFRDYLYITLGGKKSGKKRWLVNVFIVFIISGFWHGANWTFLIWGALHGTYYVFAQIIKRYFSWRTYISDIRNKTKRFVFSRLKIFFTFNLICIAWVFFRADSIDKAMDIISKIFFINNFDGNGTMTLLRYNSLLTLVMTILLLTAFILTDSIMFKIIREEKFIKYRTLGYFVYTGILVCIFLFGQFNDTKFIYFQF